MKYSVLLVLCLVGCSQSHYGGMLGKVTSQYSMSCTDNVADNGCGLLRCENSEAVCYKSCHGLQCKFKEAK